MNIYTILFFLMAILSLLLGGTREKNKQFIYVAVFILFAVCALRGVRVGSDLGRYETHYRACFNSTWESLFAMYGGGNSLFYIIMKLHSSIFGYQYHSFLFLLATFEGIVFAKTVYKNSVNPYMSIMLYMAMGYYTFVFSGLKQALATAFLFMAFDAIQRKSKLKYIIYVVVAVFIHLPAIVFVPAYIIAGRKTNKLTIGAYILGAIAVFTFRSSLLQIMTDSYDTVVSSTQLGGVGGKVVVMAFMIILGLLLRKPSIEDTKYCTLMHFMCIATIFQIFAVYGNVFERLADYYFIFVIFYLPYVLEPVEFRDEEIQSVVPLNYRTSIFANIALFGFAFVFFYTTIMSTYGLLPYLLN